MQREPLRSQQNSDNQNQSRLQQSIQKSNISKRQQSLMIKFNAIIRTGFFPQFQNLSIFYTIRSGTHWKKYSGQSSGISQFSSSPQGKIIWNFPIQITFQTSYLIDPPQIIFIMYGYDFFGRSLPKAYGNIHFPLIQHKLSQRRKAKMFKINQSMSFAKIYSFFTGAYHQFQEIEKVLQGQKQRAMLRTKTCGELEIQFSTKRFNFQKYGYQS